MRLTSSEARLSLANLSGAYLIAANLTGATTDKSSELLSEIASFYEPKRAEALHASKKHCEGSQIVYDSGRRLKSGTADEVRLLVKELLDASTSGRTGGVLQKQNQIWIFTIPRSTQGTVRWRKSSLVSVST